MKEPEHAIAVTVYTDPLCCWSWAFEPQLQKLQEILGPKASWQYRMGGLLPSWNNYHDAANAVMRPAQMGPVWMHAGEVANMPIAHMLWVQDPPASSYPACIAVKCAELQSAAAGEWMLRLLRTACMSAGKNIARKAVILEVAQEVETADPDFSAALFLEDFENNKGQAAFRSELEQVRYFHINRFPSLVIHPSGSKAVIVSGYKHYTEVLKVIETVSPGIVATTA